MAQIKKTQAQDLRNFVAEWRTLGNDWPTAMSKVVAWALKTGRIAQSSQSVVQFWAKKLQEALSQEMYTDPQGRRVRRKHCFPEMTESPTGTKYVQYLWCDIESASPDQMRSSFTYRRDKMVSEGVQLKTDVDSYNDNNKEGVQIQLSLNLTYDVEEALGDGEYNPGK